MSAPVEPRVTAPGRARWSTRGQPSALAAVARMVAGPTPHAVLLVGPPAVGKTTLAEDLAAALLCEASDIGDRPCRACRGCRLVAAGNHPDLHRLAPEGPGGQVVIGDAREARAARGVRDLVRDLALLPIEGGARVAIVEGAAQMNEDAQNALLKTLEEPPAGVTIVLCVDREELLLPTVRSRCARIRLGPAGPREIEALLGDLGLADAATAGRLAHLAEGRPGVAVAYARAPEAVAIRDEIARTLLDLLPQARSRRLAAVRELLGRAGDLAEALASVTAPPAAQARGRPRRPAGGRAIPPSTAGPDQAAPEPAAGAEAGSGESAESDATRLTAAERRRAARQLLSIWRDLARDLAVAGLGGSGGRRAIHDLALLEELEAAASGLPPATVAGFLDRLDRVAESVAGNVSPELAVDVLVLAWPSTRPVAG
jgi:DNA polymerase-3 subunit delta'